VVVGVLVHGPVVDQQPALVEEGTVADLARCAASTASPPRNSHLLSGETSQTPTPSRTARYSFSGSPKPVTQNQPASSSKPAAVGAMISWKAVRRLSPVSVLIPSLLLSRLGLSRSRRALIYHEAERLFKSAVPAGSFPTR
jgi:hypothetical protein